MNLFKLSEKVYNKMQNKAKRVFQKYFEYLITKIKLIFLQRKFRFEDVEIKYILKKNVFSKDLIVIFGSCTRNGIKARYNYMRTLEKVRANKLFILDDFAEDQRGSYYLGANWKFNEEHSTLALIKKIMKDIETDKVICCGSSKGGYAAIDFGLQIDSAYIVAGAPQYFLYDYLREDKSRLEYIMGSYSQEKANCLNCYLQNRIRSNQSGNHKFFLHFSNKEHTYFEHVEHLISELRLNGFDVSCDVSDYTNHSDLSYFFPDFLVSSLNEILL